MHVHGKCMPVHMHVHGKCMPAHVHVHGKCMASAWHVHMQSTPRGGYVLLVYPREMRMHSRACTSSGYSTVMHTHSSCSTSDYATVMHDCACCSPLILAALSACFCISRCACFISFSSNRLQGTGRGSGLGLGAQGCGLGTLPCGIMGVQIRAGAAGIRGCKQLRVASGARAAVRRAA